MTACFDMQNVPSMEFPVHSVHLPRVLVVDDDSGGAFVMKCYLEQFGCPHDVATTGTEALRLLGQGTYDVVLMDVKMPDIDGFEVVRRIREEERQTGKPRIRIIAVTAFAFIEDRNRCLSAGMDDYISKPFHFHLLHQKLGLESLAP